MQQISAAIKSESLETAAPKTIKIKVPFKPFTGKVKGNKVRLRLQPDVESSIVQELFNGDLLTIVDDCDDFYAVEAPSDLKAYVFRSFVLDNQIEGTRVNVRLKPSLEAPVITHLNSGDSVSGMPCSENSKWVELGVPASSRFYVAKDYIENCGGTEVKAKYEGRLKQARQQIETAEYFVESEMQKAYPNIDFDKVNHSFQTVIQEYSEFPQLVEKAKDTLASVQEQFLEKRIHYLELKATEEASATLLETEKDLILTSMLTEKMKVWEPVEETLYQNWLGENKSGSMDEYYEEQKLSSNRISGTLEEYKAPVKCKPANYILKENDIPVGYVYSTMINLDNLVGKKVTLVGAPRPNNNFAFPAYFVFSVEN